MTSKSKMFGFLRSPFHSQAKRQSQESSSSTSSNNACASTGTGTGTGTGTAAVDSTPPNNNNSVPSKSKSMLKSKLFRSHSSSKSNSNNNNNNNNNTNNNITSINNNNTQQSSGTHLSQCQSPSLMHSPLHVDPIPDSIYTDHHIPIPIPTDSNFSANRQRSSTYPSTKLPKSSSSTSPCSPSRRRSPSPPPKNRARLNSREIPRTYSGLYGIGGGHELTHQTQTPASDLLPFELARNFNTEWLHSYPYPELHHNNTSHLRNNIMSSSLFWVYIFFIVFVEFSLVVLPLPIVKNHVEMSFTITNVLHGIITLTFLHWLKGSPNFYDYGELNAMTLWEQLSCSPDSNVLAMQTKQVLYIIPTVLCYLSCRFVNFDLWISLVNLSVWSICIVAKMEGMHGVRLFGFNRTIGIDDDVRKSK